MWFLLYLGYFGTSSSPFCCMTTVLYSSCCNSCFFWAFCCYLGISIGLLFLAIVFGTQPLLKKKFLHARVRACVLAMAIAYFFSVEDFIPFLTVSSSESKRPTKRRTMQDDCFQHFFGEIPTSTVALSKIRIPVWGAVLLQLSACHRLA